MLLTRRSALGALSVATLTALTACGRDAGGGSGAGRTKLVEGAIDFAGTNTPMTVDETSRVGGAGPTVGRGLLCLPWRLRLRAGPAPCQEGEDVEGQEAEQ